MDTLAIGKITGGDLGIPGRHGINFTHQHTVFVLVYLLPELHYNFQGLPAVSCKNVFLKKRNAEQIRVVPEFFILYNKVDDIQAESVNSPVEPELQFLEKYFRQHGISPVKVWLLTEK